MRGDDSSDDADEVEDEDVGESGGGISADSINGPAVAMIFSSTSGLDPVLNKLNHSLILVGRPLILRAI